MAPRSIPKVRSNIRQLFIKWLMTQEAAGLAVLDDITDVSGGTGCCIGLTSLTLDILSNIASFADQDLIHKM